LHTLEKYDDDKLIELTLRGEKRGYEALVRRYQKLVFNVIFQLLKDDNAAADVTQETFLKAYKALSTFDRKRSFRPWLLRIATNTALNLIRANKPHESLDSLLELAPSEEPRSGQDVESEVESSLTREHLTRILDKMKPIHRHIFLLRYQRELSYEEISEIMGEPVTTIKSLLFRVRTKVREMFMEAGSVVEG
jgi:RNA polymerase sigma-70 factor (ECF subfamily)